jgi:hypothetical protein
MDGGSMVHHVLYTREQADRVLPLVRAILEDQREVYMRVRRALSKFNGFESLTEITGDHHLPQRVRDELAELRGTMLELDEIGVRVLDPELGLVAFRGIHRGEVVNLCWKLGEDRVRFWYPRDGDYAGRRPLDVAQV